MEQQYPQGNKVPMFKLGFWLLFAVCFFFLFKGQDIFFKIIASVIASFLGVYAFRLLGKVLGGIF